MSRVMDNLNAMGITKAKGDIPEFVPGDTVRVHKKIKEGDKVRVQIFQGTVIQQRGGGAGATFTVRKLSGGIGVEQIFPVQSPNVTKVEVLRRGKVRRAKLYYLRGLTGRSARVREKVEVGGKKKTARKTKSE